MKCLEVIAKIDETRWNRALDVVVGIMSFVPTFLLAPALAPEEARVALAVIFIVDAALSFLGWRESQKGGRARSNAPRRIAQRA